MVHPGLAGELESLPTSAPCPPQEHPQQGPASRGDDISVWTASSLGTKPPRSLCPGYASFEDALDHL